MVIAHDQWELRKGGNAAANWNWQELQLGDKTCYNSEWRFLVKS